MEIPKDVLEVAMFLKGAGYSMSEAYPIESWRRHGWSEKAEFFQAVDGCIKLIKAIEKMSSR